MKMFSQTNINHRARLIDIRVKGMRRSVRGVGERRNEKGVEVCADDVTTEEVEVEVVLQERVY